jgi:hypothetical protein
VLHVSCGRSVDCYRVAHAIANDYSVLYSDEFADTVTDSLPASDAFCDTDSFSDADFHAIASGDNVADRESICYFRPDTNCDSNAVII